MASPSYSTVVKTKKTDFLLAYNVGVVPIAINVRLLFSTDAAHPCAAGVGKYPETRIFNLEAEIQTDSQYVVGGGFSADGCIALGFYFGVVTEQTG